MFRHLYFQTEERTGMQLVLCFYVLFLAGHGRRPGVRSHLQVLPYVDLRAGQPSDLLDLGRDLAQTWGPRPLPRSGGL